VFVFRSTSAELAATGFSLTLTSKRDLVLHLAVLNLAFTSGSFFLYVLDIKLNNYFTNILFLGYQLGKSVDYFLGTLPSYSAMMSGDKMCELAGGPIGH
jgi:hypothetical protein